MFIQNRLKQKKKIGRRGRNRFELLRRAARGQALVLLAVSFLALLAFIGLVTDVGSIYLAYTHLQRAIDAAAVAAANNIKNPQASATLRKQRITEAAREMLNMHEITGISDLQVFLCDDANRPSRFAAMCPTGSQPKRKLAYIEATQIVPVYFLQIFGVQSFPLHASAVGETAALDLVLVFDTSESMGIHTTGYDPNNFNPTSCNTNNDCQPLKQAKDAAKNLIANLFDGYDRIAVVTFDYQAHLLFDLSDNLGDDDGAEDDDAFAAVDTLIRLHDDADAVMVPWAGKSSPNGGYRAFNPIWAEDRDGDGRDADPGRPCTDEFVNNTDGTPGANYPDMWADEDDDSVLKGDPCDRDDILDVFDWDKDGIWYDPATGDHDTDDEIDPTSSTFEDTSLLSTCYGCGIRVATETLQNDGRSGAVWVIVFLSDGIANLSDTPDTNPTIPSQFQYGFCGHNPATAFWASYCIDPNTGASEGRYCIDLEADECPPTAAQIQDPDPPFPNLIKGHTTTSGPYSVEDYALDWVDTAALLESFNPNEPRGEDIVMFSIGLGAASGGEALLRYMANVGDDGSRGNDPCRRPDGTEIEPLHNCGNYYYAPTGSYLSQIFENIASRIFTKISR